MENREYSNKKLLARGTYVYAKEGGHDVPKKGLIAPWSAANADNDLSVKIQVLGGGGTYNGNGFKYPHLSSCNRQDS